MDGGNVEGGIGRCGTVEVRDCVLCGFERDVGSVGWRGGRDVHDVEYWALGRRLCAQGVEHHGLREVLILLRLIYAATDHHLLSEPGCIA